MNDIRPSRLKGNQPVISSSKPSTPLFSLLLVIVTIAVYANALSNGFVYDDSSQLLQNKWITSIRYIPDIFTKSVWSFKEDPTVSNYYRPLMHLIYMSNYHLFGMKAWAFHLVNILFHSTNTILVFLIIQLIVNSRTERPGSSTRPAFLAALVFAVHPIHTEAVVWVAGIPELSFTFFSLLSFYFYLKSKKGHKTGYILSLVFFCLAAFCKETALVLPLIIFLFDIASTKSVGGYWHLKKYIPYLCIATVSFGLRVYALGGVAPEARHTYLTVWQYFINIFPLFAAYIGKLLLPVNLNAFHVFHPVTSVLESRSVIALIVTILFLFAVAVVLRRDRLSYWGLLMFALPLLPALYIPGLGENTFAERYLYLPSVGLSFIIAAALLRIDQGAAPLAQPAAVVLCLIIVSGAAATIKRNAVWKDEFSLWTDTVGKSPDGIIPRNYLGSVLFTRGETEAAIAQFRAVVAMNPDDAESHNNLAVALKKKGLFAGAIPEYKRAIALNPKQPDFHSNLGNAYRDSGLFDEAFAEYDRALAMRPNDADLHNDMGIAYIKKGDINKAIEHLSEAVRLDPSNDGYRNDLSDAEKHKLP